MIRDFHVVFVLFMCFVVDDFYILLFSFFGSSMLKFLILQMTMAKNNFLELASQRFDDE